MCAAKKQHTSSELKWQNFQSRRSTPGGKKPLPDPTTVQHVFVMLAMHICRKIVLFDPQLKVAIYLGALVCGSLVCDFAPIPRSYLSRKSNIFNYYFVKWGWGWTLTTVGIFLALSTWVYCCGNIDKIKKHFYRLLLGTFVWFFWTKLFVYIEAVTSSCISDKFGIKTCRKGFDISGHAFLLVYCSLLIAEEAKSIRGWERIGDLIRNEDYDDDSPLKSLSEFEKRHLQEYYDKLTPYIRASFILLTLFSLLWDVMLVTTIIYFHSMVQKVVGGIIAILMWYATYHWWYCCSSSPGLPGQGCFKYSDHSFKRMYSQ